MRAMTYERPQANLDLARENVQHREFGGFHFGAAFFGWLNATAVSVLLISLLTAAGSAVALTATNSTKDLVHSAATVGVAGGILLFVAMLVAYYAGGYVAGRMARFDGGIQGFGVWIIGLIITAILGAAGAAFGANYNLLQQVHLPSIPVSAGSFTTGGIITALAILLGTLLAAIAGGKMGTRYHRKIDTAGHVVSEE